MDIIRLFSGHHNRSLTGGVVSALRNGATDHLASHVVGSPGEPDRHAHQPIAHDGLHKRGSEGAVALLLGRSDRERLDSPAEEARVRGEESHEATAEDIARVRDEPTLGHVLEAHQTLVQRSGHRCTVAREKLPAGVEDE